jgi:hypothetical protein
MIKITLRMTFTFILILLAASAIAQIRKAFEISTEGRTEIAFNFSVTETVNLGTYSVTAGASSYLNISNNGTSGTVTTFDQKTGQVLDTKTGVQIHSEAITRTSNGCLIPASVGAQTSKGTVDRLVRIEAANLNSGGTLLVIRAASCGN